MKLQLGLLHLDGRHASADVSRNLLGEFGDTYAETAGETADGILVMAYRGHRITHEETSEVQPLRHGSYIMTWDGRLDNRDELADRTQLRHYETLPDNRIVLCAYERFGDSIFSDLIGEFALALWCGKTKSLRFARSACGTRTLYYVRDRDTLFWSSNFAHLVRISGVNLAVNDEYVVEYLISQPKADATPLQHFAAVPSNTFLHFRDGRLVTKRGLWNPTRVSPLHYRTDGEYEEHFREQIRNAVKARLRAKQPVFAELSGGLDSSTIVLMANRILRDQGEPIDKLQTVSCVYEQSETCDESAFIHSVAGMLNVEPLLVHEADQKVTLGLADPQFTGIPNALHCFPGRYQTIAAYMRQHNSRLLLTGRGGDHLFWSEPDGTPIIADEIRKGNLIRAHAECRKWSQAASAPYLEMLLNRALPTAFECFFPQRFRYNRIDIPAWLTQRYKRHFFSASSASVNHTSWRTAPSRRTQLAFLQHMFQYIGSGFLQEFDDLYISHPYSHRPLVEFCLSVPVSQFLRNGETRSLMRRSFKGILPRKIFSRMSKGLLDEAIVRALRKEWSTLASTSNWQVCNFGYVSHPHLMNSLGQARLGIASLTGCLARLFSLERWLRSLSNARSDNRSAASGINSGINFSPAILGTV